MIDVKQLYLDNQKLANQEVTLGGWAKSVRDNGSFGFIDFNDGTHFKGVQVVFNNELDNFDAVKRLNAGSSMVVKGTLLLTPANKQPFEIHATKVEIVNATDTDYPLQKKRHSIEFLREIAYLRPRTNLFQAVFRIRSVAAMAVHEYFQSRGYVYVNTPIITTADCEDV